MTLGEFIEAAATRPDLYDRELVVEHIPGDVSKEQLLFTAVPGSPSVWVEPC